MPVELIRGIDPLEPMLALRRLRRTERGRSSLDVFGCGRFVGELDAILCRG